MTELRGIRIYEEAPGSWWLDVEQQAPADQTFDASTGAVKELRVTTNHRLLICNNVEGIAKFYGRDLYDLYVALQKVRQSRGF